MPQRMILHDTRVEGRPPHIAQNTYPVDQNVPIQHAIGWVAQHARNVGGLDELLIMCHGYEWDANNAERICTGRGHGGFGLLLCRESLSLYNVNLVSAWKPRTPLIRRIVVYACAAADVGPGNSGTDADGHRFMGEMALWSGAEVVAARDTQHYHRNDSWPARFLGIGRIDFGEWEGPVYRFDPNTGQGRPYMPGPMQ